MSAWHVERIVGSAGALHGLDLPVPLSRTIWRFSVDRPTLVLASTQRDDAVDLEAVRSLGAEVVRRRSGGGAVWLEPGGTSWVDVLVPRGDPLWDDDVGRAAHWLGHAWTAAIGDPASAHVGAMVGNTLSGRVCFAGLGPGEVTIGGRKVVGISQRRTREGARFQCVAYREFDPNPLVRALRLTPEAGAGLADAAVGLGPSLPDVEEALVDRLP